jgi:hypothetical protein
MRKIPIMFGSCALGVALLSFGSPAGAAPKYTIFDLPKSEGTYPTSINESGVITGWYYTIRHKHWGDVAFIRAADGSFSTLNVYWSFGYCINSQGAATGGITDAGYTFFEGFVWVPGGTYTQFQVGDNSSAASINASGIITGSYNDGGQDSHGYVRSTDGTITTFDAPQSISTTSQSINEKGVIAGYYEDSNSVDHGFVRAADGTFTSFDPQGSVSTSGLSINGKGVITGDYVDSNSVDHAFVRAADGTITTFDPQGSVRTNATSINDKGAITGWYEDSTTIHGFVRTSDGTIMSFDVPGSAYTYAASINAKGAITGYYYDKKNRIRGYVRSP